MPDTLRGNRLLVVDDEAAYANLIKRAAQGCGFEVVVTDDARSFANTARTWHPSVIMLDLNMPDTDGIQLLRWLAADQCPAHVVISSGADGRILEAAMRLGRERGLKMSGTLPKPFRIEAFREMMAGFRCVPKSQLIDDLAEAIATDQLFLEFQPKFDCIRGRFTGVEALCRWRHPSLGMIRPDEFIPLAEENDLIRRLTDRVVGAAARQASLWRDDNIDIEVAVNISSCDAEDLELPERLHQHCVTSGIRPSSLVLELTETGAMREAVPLMDVLTRLRIKGFRLSIDDFGTGYSSMVQLQRLPFSELKIDQSFVMNMTSNESCRVIAEITIDLARKLSMGSVVEGVEDEGTLQALIALGCNTAQGYHLGRPTDADSIAELVAHARPLK